MPSPITAQKSVEAIVARSGNVVVPYEGALALVPGHDGKFRLEERLIDGMAAVGLAAIRPRDAKGRRLPPGHVLSHAEVERACS
jgi:hypothetical protein